MLEHEAKLPGRLVPVFGGDLNQHIITHHGSATEIHCAATGTLPVERQLAVGCMRHLLEASHTSLLGLQGKPDAQPSRP